MRPVRTRSAILRTGSDSLFQKRAIRFHRPTVELAIELLAEIAARRVLHERDHVGVGESDVVGVVVVTAFEVLDVGVRHPFEVVLGDDEMVLVLVDVALEGDPDLDHTFGEPFDLRPRGIFELVSGPAQVAEPELQEPRLLAYEAGRFGAFAEVLDGPIEVGAKHQLNAPLLDLLLCLVTGIPDVLVDVDVAHEGGLAEGTLQQI